MEVILREDFASLGYVGDKVNVRRGYARNFLIPRGIAIDATTRNERLLKHNLSAITAKRVKLKAAAEEEAKRIGEISLQFTLKAGKHGKTFGSITAKDICAALELKGVKIDRKRIKLSEPLKRSGTFAVDARLHAEVSVPLNVEIVAEKFEEEKSEEKGEGEDQETKRRGRRAGGAQRGRRAKGKASEDQLAAAAQTAASSEEE